MRALLWIAGLAGVAGSVAAQPAASSSVSPSPSVPLIRETVVVTAALAPTERDETPAAVSVVDAAEIAARRAVEVQDLLRTLPGMTVVRSGSPGKVTSLFTRGANSNQTLVLWDGVPVNDAFGGAFDWAFLPTEGVERIEAVRGPASALYGGDAVGGVVQVLTGRSRGLSLRLEGGSDAYRRAAAVAGADLGPVHFDLTGHVRRGDGEVDNDGFDADEAVVRATWQAAPGTTLGLTAQGNDSRVGIPFDFAGAPTPRRRQDREIALVSLPFDWQGEDWSVSARAARVATELVFSDPDDPFSAGATDAASETGRAVATWRASDRLWIAGGGDWERQEAENVDAFSRLEAATQRTWAGFGQLHWRTGRTTLDLGLRRDDADTFGAQTSARLGAVVELPAGTAPRPGWGWRARAAYGEAFRPPTLVDLYFPGFGNPDLAPEQSETLEAGLDAEGAAGGGRWHLALTGFATDQEDLILFDFATFLPQNVGRARSRGVELEAGWTAGAFRARLSATRLDAENLDTGAPLPRRPEESGSLVLSWSPAEWTLSAAVRHAGDRVDVGDVPLPAYTTVDLAAGRRFGRLEPYLRIENLFDERYEEADGFPAPDRALAGGLAVRF